MIKHLKEDEAEICKIVGEEKFVEILTRFGGFSIYFSKPHFKSIISKALADGKSKRQICLDLRMSESQYYKILNEKTEE